MNKKQLIAAWGITILLLSGCAMLEPHYGSSLQEPSSAEVELRKYDDVFFSIYDSNLRSWVGKSIEEVKSVFEVTPGEHGCCGPNIHSLDVDGNGYISYRSADREWAPGRSGRLIFYIRRNKIYNIVKE